MRALRIYSLHNIPACHTAGLPVVNMLGIASLVLGRLDFILSIILVDPHTKLPLYT